MTTLSVKKVIRNFKNSNGNYGTLVIFNEELQEGERKGQNAMFWSASPEYKLESKFGWELNGEEVLEPIISVEDSEDRKLKRAAEYGTVVTF